MSPDWRQKCGRPVGGPSGTERRVRGTMAQSAPVKVTNAELATVREAMRELPRLLAELDAGTIDKLVEPSASDAAHAASARGWG